MTRISRAGAAVALTVLLTAGGAATALAAPAGAPAATVDAQSGDLSHAAVGGLWRNVSSSVVYDRESNRLATTLTVGMVFVHSGARGTATTSVLSASGESLWTVTQTGVTPCTSTAPGWPGMVFPSCKAFVGTVEHTPPASVADRVQQQAARVVTTVANDW